VGCNASKRKKERRTCFETEGPYSGIRLYIQYGIVCFTAISISSFLPTRIFIPIHVQVQTLYTDTCTGAGERPAAAHLLKSWVRIPPGAWIFVRCECRVLSGRGLCDELITRPEESYRLCCVVVCDLETSRIGAPYIYDIRLLRVK